MPVDRDNPRLTEGHAIVSDHAIGFWECAELAARLDKSERSGRTGAGRKKRRVTG